MSLVSIFSCKDVRGYPTSRSFNNGDISLLAEGLHNHKELERDTMRKIGVRKKFIRAVIDSGLKRYSFAVNSLYASVERVHGLCLWWDRSYNARAGVSADGRVWGCKGKFK